MTKATMIRNYRKYNKADYYIIGFTIGDKLYAVGIKEIKPRFLKVEQASRGQGENLRLRLKREHKEKLKKSAICLGSKNLLNTEKYNKGEIFEKIVTEYYGQEWKKDNIPFWIQGDIRIDGKEVQIKLDTATLVNTSQIKKLHKSQR